MQFFIEEQQRYAINAAVQIKGEIYGESYHIPFKDAFYMDESVLKTTFIPQRFTLLHDYISYRLLDDYRHTLKKMGSDIYPEIYKEFESYQVVFQRFEEYRKANYNDYLYDIYAAQINFKLVWSTFTILYRNRDLMRRFNLHVSNEIKELKMLDYPFYLKRDGVMKRCTYWPEWLRKGLLKREDGHCAICQNNLTGVFANNAGIAIDHIVPLNLGGTNDPTNLQMLCGDCNSEKGGDKYTSSDKYAPFWLPNS
ncbi:TPA: HNH endonuclease [Enterobacter cloacae]|uniref:HNH endonuclease n=1 Tax=Enterobacter TaxID=547 RepID=UPI002005A1B8|nr:HNH endonuclease signature motif containing protein [Enterobacter bugandensis]EKD5652594.1 HNH endonuclease [Shigella boydii]MCK6894609.1 HNH endonuclease [Enterobacter bugandensis]HBN5336733.1 HNH endonuclease [Enterobacter cloacae]